MKDYVAFDLETTGLSLERDQIIEIGAVKVRDGKISGKYNCIIHPEIEVSDFIINLTGIDRNMLKKGISLKEGVEGFLEFSRNFPVLGHNVMFDYKFMKKAAASFKHNFEREGVDTLKVARKLLGELENKKLETLCAHYHYVNQAAHRAYDDAVSASVLYGKLEKLKPEDNSFSNTTKLVYVVKKDSPITPPQRRYLAALVEKHNINLEIPVEEMTKSMASRQIDTIIAQYGK